MTTATVERRPRFVLPLIFLIIASVIAVISVIRGGLNITGWLFIPVPFILTAVLFPPKKIRRILAIVGLAFLAAYALSDLINTLSTLQAIDDVLWISVGLLDIAILVMYLVNLKKPAVIFSIITAGLYFIGFIILLIRFSGYGFLSFDFVFFFFLFYTMHVLVRVSLMIMFIRENAPFRKKQAIGNEGTTES